VRRLNAGGQLGRQRRVVAQVSQVGEQRPWSGDFSGDRNGFRNAYVRRVRERAQPVEHD
jgi:hypothetical protein